MSNLLRERECWRHTVFLSYSLDNNLVWYEHYQQTMCNATNPPPQLSIHIFKSCTVTVASRVSEFPAVIFLKNPVAPFLAEISFPPLSEEERERLFFWKNESWECWEPACHCYCATSEKWLSLLLQCSWYPSVLVLLKIKWLVFRVGGGKGAVWLQPIHQKVGSTWVGVSRTKKTDRNILYQENPSQNQLLEKHQGKSGIKRARKNSGETKKQKNRSESQWHKNGYRNQCLNLRWGV